MMKNTEEQVKNIDLCFNRYNSKGSAEENSLRNLIRN